MVVGKEIPVLHVSQKGRNFYMFIQIIHRSSIKNFLRDFCDIYGIINASVKPAIKWHAEFAHGFPNSNTGFGGISSCIQHI